MVTGAGLTSFLVPKWKNLEANAKKRGEKRKSKNSLRPGKNGATVKRPKIGPEGSRRKGNVLQDIRGKNMVPNLKDVRARKDERPLGTVLKMLEPRRRGK